MTDFLIGVASIIVSNQLCQAPHRLEHHKSFDEFSALRHFLLIEHHRKDRLSNRPSNRSRRDLGPALVALIPRMTAGSNSPSGQVGTCLPCIESSLACHSQDPPVVGQRSARHLSVVVFGTVVEQSQVHRDNNGRYLYRDRAGSRRSAFIDRAMAPAQRLLATEQAACTGIPWDGHPMNWIARRASSGRKCGSSCSVFSNTRRA